MRLNLKELVNDGLLRGFSSDGSHRWLTFAYISQFLFF